VGVFEVAGRVVLGDGAGAGKSRDEWDVDFRAGFFGYFLFSRRKGG